MIDFIRIIIHHKQTQQVTKVKLQVDVVGGHGSVPPNCLKHAPPTSAIGIMSRALARLEANPHPVHFHYAVQLSILFFFFPFPWFFILFFLYFAFSKKLGRHQYPFLSNRKMLEHLVPGMAFSMQMIVTNLWLFKPLLMTVLSSRPETSALIRTTTVSRFFFFQYILFVV